MLPNSNHPREQMINKLRLLGIEGRPKPMGSIWIFFQKWSNGLTIVYIFHIITYNIKYHNLFA